MYKIPENLSVFEEKFKEMVHFGCEKVKILRTGLNVFIGVV